jgi:ketosteroid isomerase-like protein
MRVGVLSVVVAGLVGGLVTWQGAAAPAGASSPARTEIEKAMVAYSAAYAKGDVAGLMSFWLDNAEFIDEAGELTVGKGAIEGLFKASFRERPGRTLQLTIREFRQPRPDLVMLDGDATVGGDPEGKGIGRFASVWTKTDAGWRILSVRDLPAGDSEASVEHPLKPLDWLVGGWKHERGDTVVTITGRRTQKDSFLLLEQKVTVKGEEKLSLTHVIGWDPRLEQFRSWVFDSEGGFGGGLWERDGNAWRVTVEGVRSDAREASSINLWRFVDENTFEWSATEREIGGEPAPDLTAEYRRQSAGK